MTEWGSMTPAECVDDCDRLANVEVAAFRLLYKFHRETGCGQPYHWAECERLVDAFGWVSWEVWLRCASVPCLTPKGAAS